MSVRAIGGVRTGSAGIGGLALTTDTVETGRTNAGVLRAVRSGSAEAVDADVIAGAISGAETLYATIVDTIGGVGSSAADAGVVGGTGSLATSALGVFTEAVVAGLSRRAVGASEACDTFAGFVVEEGGRPGTIGGFEIRAIIDPTFSRRFMAILTFVTTAGVDVAVELAGTVGLHTDFAGATVHGGTIDGGGALFGLGVAEFGAGVTVSVVVARVATSTARDALVHEVADFAVGAVAATGASIITISAALTATDAANTGLVVLAVFSNLTFRSGAGPLGICIGDIANLSLGAVLAGGFDAGIGSAAHKAKLAVGINAAGCVSGNVVTATGREAEDQSSRQDPQA